MINNFADKILALVVEMESQDVPIDAARKKLKNLIASELIKLDIIGNKP